MIGMNSADILLRIHGGWEMVRKWQGGPEDRRRRVIDAFARCCILTTDRPVPDFKKIWPYQDILPFLDAVTSPDQGWWTQTYRRRIPPPSVIGQAVRKAALERITQGNLGIEDRLGVWNGSVFHGLKLSGALRKGPGTEFTIWARPELVADLSEMPLMHKLEPKAAKHGQRRLRRCYAAFLPPEDPIGRSVLAGLFAGAILRNADGEEWLELPGTQGVKTILSEWGIPCLPFERPMGKRVLHVSPLFGALVAHIMPPHSAGRIQCIRKAGNCPYLPAILWEMAMTKKHSRYMPFPNALPFACSKSTFFRRGWRRRDMHKAGWLELGIHVTPRLRELLVEWFERRSCELRGRTYDSKTFPLSPDMGIPTSPFPPPFTLR